MANETDPKPFSLPVYDKDYDRKSQASVSSDITSRNGASQAILKDYFQDMNTYYFKYGMQVYDYNLKEDPTVLGFDVRINTISSPFFTNNNEDTNEIENIESFLNFFSTGSNNIKEIAARKEIYKNFRNQFTLFFDSASSSDLRNFKAHYLQSVKGLDNLVLGKEKKFTKFGEDKLTFSISEDIELNSGYMAALYNALVWSKNNGKQLIPSNLLRFDMDIIISEVRNFNQVRYSFNNGGSGHSIKQLLSDNVSRYVYHLYECNLSFDKMSHGDEVDNTDKEVAEGFEFDIYYKFASMEMEKFQLDNRYYFNSESVDPQQPPLLANELNINFENKKPYISFVNEDQENATKEAEETSPLMKIVNNTAKYVVKKIETARDNLINDLIADIRTATGLRRISSPINVYNNNFIIDQLRDFANKGVTDALSGLNDKINGK